MISYRNYSRLTIDCRMAAARKSLGILHPWLFKRHGLPRFRKVQIWFQCIFPCVTAGLLATGVDQHSLALVDAFSIKCFRRIYQQPVHLDHINNKDFLEHHHIRDPLKALRSLCIKTIHRENVERISWPAQTFYYTIIPQHTRNTWRAAYGTLSRVWSNISEPYQCHLCHRHFSTLTGLNEHIFKQHREFSGRLRSYQPAVDQQQGLPTCSRCGKHFTTWYGLKTQIEYTSIVQTHRTSLRSMLHTPWELPQHPILCRYLASHCILCGQFLNSKIAMQVHWKTFHPRQFSKQVEGFN